MGRRVEDKRAQVATLSPKIFYSRYLTQTNCPPAWNSTDDEEPNSSVTPTHFHHRGLIIKEDYRRRHINSRHPILCRTLSIGLGGGFLASPT